MKLKSIFSIHLFKCISKVRAGESVNMPPIPETVAGEALRSRLCDERRIELAFESHRFFDIRWWKIAGVTENRPVRGMDVLKDLSTGKITYKSVQLEVKGPYEDKMNLLPIETNEIRRNPELSQTPGW